MRHVRGSTSACQGAVHPRGSGATAVAPDVRTRATHVPGPGSNAGCRPTTRASWHCTCSTWRTSGGARREPGHTAFPAKGATGRMVDCVRVRPLRASASTVFPRLVGPGRTARLNGNRVPARHSGHDPSALLHLLRAAPTCAQLQQGGSSCAPCSVLASECRCQRASSRRSPSPPRSQLPCLRSALRALELSTRHPRSSGC